MLITGHPFEYQGLLKARFEKAASRSHDRAPKVFKNSDDLANFVVRACNAGALIHFIVAEALDVKPKDVHRTLRSLPASEIHRTCELINKAHQDRNYFDATHEDRPVPKAKQKLASHRP